MVTAPARRELVRQMIDQGLNERQALRVARMSADAYRYAPRPDRNVDLRQQIASLAQRHRRYGVGMIHLKLRQAGLVVNYKRVERLYRQAQLQVRRRKRKRYCPVSGSRWCVRRVPTRSGRWTSCSIGRRKVGCSSA